MIIGKVDKKKITFVINNLEIGGTEKQLLLLVKSIKEDYEINIFSFGHGALSDSFKSQKIKIFFGNGILSYLKFFYFLIINQTDIYHFLLPKSYIVGGVATFFIKKKKIMSRRSMNFYHKKYFFVSLFIEKILHKKMDLIITNNYQAKKQLITDENVKSSKIMVIPNLIEPPLLKKQKKKNNVITFIYIANFYKYKRHKKLIDVCSKIIVKKKWKLLMVGDDRENLKDNLKKKIKELKLQQNIKILPLQSSLSRIYQNAHFALSASSEEGSSNFLLESISYGLPIIAFDVGDNKKFFSNNGFLIKQNDFRELKHNLELMINYDLKKFKKKSLELFRSKLLMNSSVNLYKKVYGNLINS